MNTTREYWVVIPAAGVGKRMLADRPKQYLPLAGKTVLENTLGLFCPHSNIRGVVIALEPNDAYWADLDFPDKDDIMVVNGGKERCYSVLNALQALHEIAASDAWVLVHDAARPCLPVGDLDRLMTELENDATGGILALPVSDTLKRDNGSGRIEATVDRRSLWRALTPQMFPLNQLRNALENCISDGFEVTDEASAMEHAGHAPRLIPGQAQNIKVTQPEDLALAEYYLSLSETRST